MGAVDAAPRDCRRCNTSRPCRVGRRAPRGALIACVSALILALGCQTRSHYENAAGAVAEDAVRALASVYGVAERSADLAEEIVRFRQEHESWPDQPDDLPSPSALELFEVLLFVGPVEGEFVVYFVLHPYEHRAEAGEEWAFVQAASGWMFVDAADSGTAPSVRFALTQFRASDARGSWDFDLDAAR